MRAAPLAVLLLAMPLLTGVAHAQPKPDASAPAPGSAPDTWVSRDTADVLVLDKVNAKSTSVTLKVGQAAANATLSIALRACVIRPPDLPRDSAAYFDITDSRPGAPSFHGWMLANEPAVSMLQHPIYTVRLVACH